MDTINRLKQAAESKWTWLRHALFLREAVSELISEFQSSPTHVQVSELKSKVAELTASLESATQSIDRLENSLIEADQKAEAEYAKLKAKYDKRLHATETEQVQALKVKIAAERDAKHLVQIELKDIKERFAQHIAEHEKAKEGNRALIRFIHTRHRLNLPLEPGSMRELLQKADEKS